MRNALLDINAVICFSRMKMIWVIFVFSKREKCHREIVRPGWICSWSCTVEIAIDDTSDDRFCFWYCGWHWWIIRPHREWVDNIVGWYTWCHNKKTPVPENAFLLQWFWTFLSNFHTLSYIRNTEVNEMKLVLQTLNYFRNSVWKFGRKVQSHHGSNAFCVVGSFYWRTL